MTNNNKPTPTFVGNFKDWIKDEWIEFMLDSEGETIPADPSSDNEDRYVAQEIPWTGQYPEHGLETWEYRPVAVNYKSHVLPYEPKTLPFEIDNDGWECFFLKIFPGWAQPVHVDYPICEKMIGKEGIKDAISTRFWMPLQDYKRGHIFFYEDQILSDYKKGDIFQYAGTKHWHAGANIGHATRLTCNITTWKFVYD